MVMYSYVYGSRSPAKIITKKDYRQKHGHNKGGSSAGRLERDAKNSVDQITNNLAL
jgi:hypothetical protein